MGHDGEHLPDEGDGLVAHGVGVSDVGLDNGAERLLHAILDFLR